MDEDGSFRSGQAIIFLIVVLVILALLALWTFDVHKVFYVKAHSQNAGDAAALAAARWQGISLNVVGDLNIMQAVALMGDDMNGAAQIAELQARMLYVGPMVSFMSAQQAAKNNRIYANEDFTDAILDHAETVRDDYPTAIGPNGDLLFPEPWDGAWAEYADMLFAIAGQGIAAAPDNARFYVDYTSTDHMLLNPMFYDAIFGRIWCWFYHNAYDVLVEYTDYRWWPPLPPLEPTPEPINSEFFGLGLTRLDIIDDLATIEAMNERREQRDLSDVDIAPTNDQLSGTWYAYNASIWSSGTPMSGTATSAPPLPLTGELKPQYDYAGADAVARVESESSRLTPGADAHPITWTAAAKPFGYLNDDDRPNQFQIVLPAFHDVRLIPLSASSAPAGGAFSILWRIHITVHLPAYEQQGLSGLSPTCWHCDQLRTWEPAAFRNTGIAWLANSSNTCISVGGGGGGGGGSPGGGTQIAH